MAGPEAVGKQATSPATSTARTKASARPARAEFVISADAHGIFACCITRAQNLIKIHEAAHGKSSKPERYLSDAHRAAIVLSISALDAFVRSFVIARIRALLAERSAVLPTQLATQIKSFLKDDVLLEAARKDDLLDRVEKAFREDFEKRSFQGTRQITECLKLVGYNDIFHDVAVHAGENEDTMRRKLDAFTKRRHVIAHRGDFDLTKNPPEEHSVTKREATECIKLVTLIAGSISKLSEKS